VCGPCVSRNVLREVVSSGSETFDDAVKDDADVLVATSVSAVAGEAVVETAADDSAGV
jgi:hypothetical protein